MDKTARLKGITIFAWVIIVGSAFDLLFNLPTSRINPVISVYFYLLMAPFSLVTGIGLLRLKNWARIAILVISPLVMAENIFTTPYVVAKMAAPDPRIARILEITTWTLVGLVLIFNAAILYYFTRPKVKEQFEKHVKK